MPLFIVIGSISKTKSIISRKPSLSELIHTMANISNWPGLGRSLGIARDKITEIQGRHSSNKNRAKEELFELWLLEGENVSWKTIVMTLLCRGYKDEAKDIMRKYLGKANPFNTFQL